MDGVGGIRIDGQTRAQRKPFILIAADDAAFVGWLEEELSRTGFAARALQSEDKLLDKLVCESPTCFC